MPWERLVEMDPVKTVEQLGTGSTQIVLAVIVVALSGVAYKLASALIESFKDRIVENRETLKQSSADTRLVTDSLRDMKATIDLALAALKGRA